MKYRYANQAEVIKAALSIMEKRAARYTQSFTKVSDVKEYAFLELANEEREHFLVMFLDNQHRLVKAERMFSGTIDGASVYPREVVKAALINNAAAVIFAHNHPSGVAEPSSSDRTITNRLVTALGTVDIRVLDHIVVGSDRNCTSFAERGWI